MPHVDEILSLSIAALGPAQAAALLPPGANTGLTLLANPSASIGLSAVNGVASTAQRSDSAPALSQAISPTWSGTHTFSLSVNLNGSAVIPNATTLNFKNLAGTALGVLQLFSDNNIYFDSPVAGGGINLRTNAATKTFAFGSGGTLAVPGALGVNGVSPPAQVTGFGTPTGAAVLANFPGASATLVQCSNAIAEIYTVLKALGFIGT